MSLNKFIDRQRSKLNREKPRNKATNNLHGAHLHGFFTDEDGLSNAPRDDIQKAKVQQQVKDVKAQVAKRNIGPVSEEDIAFALRLPFTSGSIGKTTTLLSLINDSENLVVRPYDESAKFQGAVNRTGVTCYLDSVLFAMFAQLKSFEVMLNNKLEDRNRNHLASLLRLWVNVQRSGYLVTTDITREIQEALGLCGWTDATAKRQQDALEAFTFILEQLGFPDLHLKMDIFHSGKEDKDDDHKIVRERVLVMPLPEPNPDGSPIKLEDCFELALIARIDVRRKYELERRATISSVRSPQAIDFQKSAAVHVEAVEVSPSDPYPPRSDFKSASFPPEPSGPPPPYRPSSFIQEREAHPDEKALEDAKDIGHELPRSTGRGRAQSLRKEVLMPAWQMYSLIPFHTGEEPKSDAEVVQQLREKQPTFCIALKRYTFSMKGQASRRDDYVDIPLDMALPHFIQDNSTHDSNHLFEKFKISLQSLVCHRGTHVESGHYVSLVRVPGPENSSKWLLFDDLADKRVKEIDIHKALKDEMPYLLFYRVEPIDEPRGREMMSSNQSEAGDLVATTKAPSIIGSETLSERPSLARLSSERTPSIRGRTSTSIERPASLAVTDTSYLSADVPNAGIMEISSITTAATNPSLTTSNTVATNQSAPVSRQASILARRPRPRSRGSSVEPLPSPDTLRNGAARTRNRLSGLFSSSMAAAAVRGEGQGYLAKPGTGEEQVGEKTSIESKRDEASKSSAESKRDTAPATAAASNEPTRLQRKDKEREKEKDREREKEREKEKARRRLNAHATLSKGKRGESRPERECSVM